jgi:hypothetical protein
MIPRFLPVPTSANSLANFAAFTAFCSLSGHIQRQIASIMSSCHRVRHLHPVSKYLYWTVAAFLGMRLANSGTRNRPHALASMN